ncbi:LysR substrate-binding domain-containing protein [Methylomonas sp. AM2-LC]|uniref:LysR substrate-binding domain-containing protein n=1 Tax=Methylomonas sp. AM2-LC TaxID=3153301 RepID=UPI00326691E2
MNLNQLELLRTLLETDFNLSKAAEKMHVVQSAASRQLQLLETELGLPLFERQGKKLTALTPLGIEIMSEVEQINEARKNIKLLADDFIDNRNGSLHIATTHTQAKYLLPGPVQNFRQKFPDIKIYMLQSSPENLINLLYQNKADVAICTEKMQDNEKLIMRPCLEWHHVAIVPKQHALASQNISLELLAKQAILTYSVGFTGRSTLETAFSHAGLSMDITLSASDSDVIKTYVRLGMGVGIIAATAYEPDKDQDLIALSLAHLIPTSVTKIAYLKHLYLPNYCRYFIEQVLNASALKAV